MPARGIIGNKPLTTSGYYSDVFGPATQFDSRITNSWPGSTNSTGLVFAEDFGTLDVGIGTYSKMPNGRYYPDGLIDYAPGSNYVISGQSNTQFGSVTGLSVAKGGSHVAVIVTTQINTTITNLFIWKKPADGYVARWQYLTVLTSGTSSNYPNVVEFHPSGNYLVYGTAGGSPASFTLYSRSGDTFSAAGTTTLGASTSIITSLAWNPDGTTLAVGTNATPYITFYNFSNGSFTLLSGPATQTAASPNCIAWNHNGTSVVCQTTNATTPMVIYNRSGNTFTAIAGITGVRVSGYNNGAISWNNTGTLVAIIDGVTAGTLKLWSRSGDTFTDLSVPAAINSAQIFQQAQFSPDGSELVVTQTSSVDIWSVTGTTVTRKTVPPIAAYMGRPTGSVYGARTGTTYAGGDTYQVSSPTRWVRWIPPA